MGEIVGCFNRNQPVGSVVVLWLTIFKKKSIFPISHDSQHQPTHLSMYIISGTINTFRNTNVDYVPLFPHTHDMYIIWFQCIVGTIYSM